MSSTRVYDAERRAFGKRFRGADVGLALTDAREVMARHLPPEWTVERTRSSDLGSGSWCYQKRKHITLARDAGLPLLLHEMAHALAPDDSHHGLAFQRTYLELVGKEMGDYWVRRLRRQLIQAKTKGYKTLAAEIAS